MKAILGGIEIPDFLSYKALFVKVFGIITAMGCGLSVGKGLYIHIAAIVSDKVMDLKIFKHLKQNLTLKNQIMRSAIAAGATATLGGPIGAVLLSIELTSSYYIVNNLYKSIFSALIVAIIYSGYHSMDITADIKETYFEAYDLNLDIFLFAVLGALSGLLGSLFIASAKRLVVYRNEQTAQWPNFRYFWAL